MRKAVVLISIVAFLNLTTGCATSTITSVPREEVTALRADSVAEYPRKILQTDLVDGRIVVFDDDWGRYREKHGEQDSVIIGMTDAGVLVVVPLQDVKSVKVKERVLDSGASNTVILVGVGIVGLVVLAGYGFSQFIRAHGDPDD